MAQIDVSPGAKKWTSRLLWGGAILAFILYRKEILDLVMDTTKILLWGIPTAAVLVSMWIMPQMWKWTFINLAKAIQYAFIKNDPLSYMDRYAETLRQKLKNLRKGKVSLKAELDLTNQQIEEDTTTVNKNLKLGLAAQQENNIKQAAFFGTEARNAKDSISMATPGKIKLEEDIKFMTELDENWEMSIKGIESFNARKRRDFTRLKKQAKVLGQSKEFLSGDTEASQIYNLSIKAANEKMAQWQADVEEFEERAKPILERGAIEKRAQTNEGLDMLKEYREKLMLPDFNNFDVPTQDAQFELVNSKVGSSTFGTSLLK